MRVQPSSHGALPAVNLVLQSIESVRNTPALYLLMLALAGSGLLLTLAQGALARQAAVAGALWSGGAYFVLFYGSNAAGLVLIDEALGRPGRHPADALRDALRLAHRLLAVGLCMLAAAVLLAGIELAPDPFMAALFGLSFRLGSGAPALSAHTSAAVTGAGVVFALGLVVPGVVYLRGLCELFLARRGLDEDAAKALAPDPALPYTPI